MKANKLLQVEVSQQDVDHLKNEAMIAHRRYLARGSEASHKLYKRLAAVWLKAKDTHDSQLASKAQQSLF